MFGKIVRKIKGQQEIPAETTFEHLERLVGEMDGLSFREVDEKLGVHTSNRNASHRGYLSPLFYKRIPFRSPEQKRKLEESATRVLRGK